MNPRLLSLLLAGWSGVAWAGQPPRLSIRSGPDRPRLELASPGVAPLAGTRYQLRLQSSADLRTWRDEGEWDAGAEGVGGLPLASAPRRFYRLVGKVVPAASSDGGADVFGYTALYEAELARVGFLTPAEFAASLPDEGYRSGLSFDPTAARFWEEFNIDPAVANAGLNPGDPGYRSADFRLDPDERELFLRNGFVVSERLGAPSFGGVYYRIFANDLPVYITADSVLHAWHITFQRMLKELEEIQLAENLREITTALWSQLQSLPPSLVNGPLKQNFRDVDHFLSVANSLLWGASEPVTVFPETQEVATNTWNAIQAEAYLEQFSLWGEARPFDFSQFKPRGYYDQSENLQCYFRGFMWVARADFRLWNPRPGDPATLRQLRDAGILARLLALAGQEQNYTVLDDVIRLFVGRPDGLNAVQLLALLRSQGIDSLSKLADQARLTALQQAVLDTDLGQQLYAGAPFAAGVTQLPRSFTFLGQRFVPDGWALAKVTFNRIRWFENIPGKTLFQDVLRRRASALDVAWAVLGNSHVGDLIAERMLDNDGVPFRDGLPYAHNLEAVAGVFRRLAPAAWEDSLYTRWLYALRALSAPTTDAPFPETMRTRAWTRRMLNTQLASYTELKHDTILYAKQPYDSIATCFYPAGFVEPAPEFWRRMAALAEAAAAGMEKVPAQGEIRVTLGKDGGYVVYHVAREWRRDVAARHCRGFAQTMRRLAELAEKELRGEPFAEADLAFFQGLMNSQDHDYYGATFDGWYPGLFYNDYTRFGDIPRVNPLCNEPDSLVADIFTAPPDEIDPEGACCTKAPAKWISC